MRALNKMLCKENPWQEFPIWKTIKLGTGLKTANDFRKALKDGGNCIGAWADDILGRPEFEKSVSAEETEVDLVVLTTSQITGKNGGTTAEVFAGAQQLGFAKCSAEVGPQLRLQYKDHQLMDVRLFIGMESIRDSVGNR